MLSRILPSQLLLLALAVGLTGCGPKQPDFPELVPVKGVIKKGKDAVSGGDIQFTSESIPSGFVVASPVEADGSYSLVTKRTTDREGESRAGAPAGKYKVIYIPPLGEKIPEKGSKGALPPGPIEVATPITVSAGQADIPIDLAKGVDILHRNDAKTDPKKGGAADKKSK